MYSAAEDNMIVKHLQAIQNVSMSVGKQVASLFLGAVVFAVAMSWNATIDAVINIWTPDNSKDSATKRASYNAIASLILTLVAVVIAAILTRIYGQGVVAGEAQTYGLL
uniref:Uncharacterized protein n=1 Tax=viral metagenome TaxID=1070528 RepID=A0A6C0C1H5_9ZZZZ